MNTTEPRHLMVDCETLGLAVDAGVWQLAIREFLIDQTYGAQFVDDGFTMNALIEPGTVSDNIRAGRQSLDWGTVKWLEEQEASPLFKYWALRSHRLFHYDTIMAYTEATREFVPEENCTFCSVGFIQSSLQDFVAQQPTRVHFWSKGKEFDKPILKNMFKASGLEAPWNYYDFHCVRDAFGLPFLFREQDPPRRKAKTHNAWDDCGEQLGLLNEAFLTIKG